MFYGGPPPPLPPYLPLPFISPLSLSLSLSSHLSSSLSPLSLTLNLSLSSSWLYQSSLVVYLRLTFQMIPPLPLLLLPPPDYLVTIRIVPMILKGEGRGGSREGEGEGGDTPHLPSQHNIKDLNSPLPHPSLLPHLCLPAAVCVCVCVCVGHDP